MSQKLYTLEDVKKNNGKNGNESWIVIKNSVYNVTKFLEEHPGGKELIEEYVGKNATKAYNDAGHSMDANQMLKELKIGELAILEETTKSKCPVLAELGKEKIKRRTKLFFCL